MKLETFIANNIRENSYILYDENTKQAVCIDPGNKNDSLLNFINENDLNLKYILLTHGHYDHVQGVPYLKDTMAKVVSHKDEVEISSNAYYNGSSSYSKDVTVIPDTLVSDNDILEDFVTKIRVIHTPGHTKGGVCYYLEDLGMLFTGDTLFQGTIGRSDFYSGDSETLLNSIREKLFTLDDDVVCFPGHSEKTSIGIEKICNPHFI